MRIATRSLFVIACVIAVLAATPAGADSLNRLQATITKIERTEGPLSISLYQPLRELGITFQTQGLYAEAIDPLRHLQQLVHAADGVYSPLQEESVELIIVSFMALGELRDADTQQEFLYRIAKLSYDEGDPDMRRANWRIANWYRNTYRYSDALEVYAKVRENLKSADRDILEKVKVLRAEALTLYLAGRCCASKKLGEANDIIATSNIFDFAEHRRSAMEYADMLVLERQAQKARHAYAEIVKGFDAEPMSAATSAPIGIRNPNDVERAIRDATMPLSAKAEITYMKHDDSIVFHTNDRVQLPSAIGEPIAMCASTITESVPIADDQDIAGYFADVSLTIDEHGRPHDIEVQGNTPPRLARYLRQVLEQTRYRPGISADGELLASTLSFRQTFTLEGGKFVDTPNGWSKLLTSHACATRPGARPANVASAAAD